MVGLSSDSLFSELSRTTLGEWLIDISLILSRLFGSWRLDTFGAFQAHILYQLLGILWICLPSESIFVPLDHTMKVGPFLDFPSMFRIPDPGQDFHFKRCSHQFVELVEVPCETFCDEIISMACYCNIPLRMIIQSRDCCRG